MVSSPDRARASEPAVGCNLNAAQDLVQNRKVFAVINKSSFAFLAYRSLLDQGVPMIGGGFDSTYYGQKGNENILSHSAARRPTTGCRTTRPPRS
jgi:hypothetical protein